MGLYRNLNLKDNTKYMVYSVSVGGGISRAEILERVGDEFISLRNFSNTYGYAANLSPDGTVFAYARSSSPYITVYQVEGINFTSISCEAAPHTISTLGSISFSTDGELMACTFGNQSTGTSVWKKNGNSYARIFNKAPYTVDRMCHLSSDGNYFALASAGAPYLSVFKRNGDNFARLSSPSGLQGDCVSCSYSSDGKYLAAILTAPTARCVIFKRDGDFFAEHTQIPVLEAAECRFSFDGRYILIRATTAPYLTVYKRRGDVFRQESIQGIDIPGAPSSFGISRSGEFIAAMHNASPNLTLFKRSGKIYSKGTYQSMALGSPNGRVSFL